MVVLRIIKIQSITGSYPYQPPAVFVYLIYTLIGETLVSRQVPHHIGYLPSIQIHNSNTRRSGADDKAVVVSDTNRRNMIGYEIGISHGIGDELAGFRIQAL